MQDIIHFMGRRRARRRSSSRLYRRAQKTARNAAAPRGRAIMPGGTPQKQAKQGEQAKKSKKLTPRH
jgi:hypothetical protein